MRQVEKIRTNSRVLKRPQYELHEYLATRDISTEQVYRLQRFRHHNRYLHDSGVICGLWVIPAKDPTRPWAVQICPGYSVGCCGEEIEVLAPQAIDVRDYLWMRPHGHSGPAYVGIRYAEELTRPVPSYQPAYGCEETKYEPSRIQDSFQVDVLWTLPEEINAKSFDFCAQDLAPCPECKGCPYLILARINLPASESIPITRGHIETGHSGVIVAI